MLTRYDYEPVPDFLKEFEAEERQNERDEKEFRDEQEYVNKKENNT